MIKSYIRIPSNNRILERIDTNTIPTLINFGNQPLSFVNHAKKAIMGEHKAKIVHPTIYSLPYTPFVINTLSDSPVLILSDFQFRFLKNPPIFFKKTLDKSIKKCGASRLLVIKIYSRAAI